MRDIVWRNEIWNANIKTRIYKTCPRSILTYATETRAETSTSRRIMRITENIKNHQGDNIRSQDIREELEVQDAMRWVKACKRFWRHHVQIMPE